VASVSLSYAHRSNRCNTDSPVKQLSGQSGLDETGCGRVYARWHGRCLSGIVCAALTFWALSHIGTDFRLTANKRASWRDIMLAGSIASVINTFGMGRAFDHNFATLGGYFIGDISGMFACMFALMLVFNAQRRLMA
jgi:hypothetical protein